MSATRYPCLGGRVVIVTGGASGIGAAFTRAFAANGARVALLDLQQEAGDALAEEVSKTGAPKPLVRRCDLTDVAALRRTFADVLETLGPASVLVNNAANDQRQDFATVTPEQFDWSIGANLRHVYFASQAVVPQMRALGGGSIVNMSSIAWMAGGPDMQAYSAAKAAIVGFTNSLATDVGKWRIRVNAIAPGLVITERQRALWFQDDGAIAAGLSRQSIPDRIVVEDIAGLGLFLASDDAKRITKQCISVNGGSW